MYYSICIKKDVFIMTHTRYTIINRNTFKELPDRKPEAFPALPRRLYIEPTSLCNLNCEMCFRKSWINESYGNIDAASVIGLMDESIFADGVDTVFFGGMGEPLIHPEIMAMIRAAKERGKKVELITNGTSLKSIEVIGSPGAQPLLVE